MTLFDFTDTDASSWEVLNDGVMGGRSEGHLTTDEGVLRFTGEVVTEGGGFTSVRTQQALDLEGYDGLELRVRGGGRTFEVDVRDDARHGGRSISRRAPFDTGPEWAWVRISFDELGATVFGRSVDAPPIDLANVQRIGIFIIDGQDGSFRLEVDAIRAYRPRPTDPHAAT